MLFIKHGFFIAITFLAGCASIPPEAPELSAELGQRIASIESANITLLNKFFNQKRREVDHFIEEEWVPELANNFFSNRRISSTWDTIVREGNKKDRLKFILKTGPRLQSKINAKRLELIQPLDDLERKIEKKIRDEYAQARAMNNSITSFLLSASDVAANRSRYLTKAGISENDLSKLIDKTDTAVTDMLSTSGKVQDKALRLEEYLDKLKSIKESI